jgi:hypothetical protein
MQGPGPRHAARVWCRVQGLVLGVGSRGADRVTERPHDHLRHLLLLRPLLIQNLASRTS